MPLSVKPAAKLKQLDNLRKGPAHKVTSETKAVVGALAKIGIQQEVIADTLDISEPTLRKHYREQLDAGKGQANAFAVNRLFQHMHQNADLKVSLASTIFWLKAQANFSEKQVVETTGKDGGPIEVENSFTIEFVDAEKEE